MFYMRRIIYFEVKYFINKFVLILKYQMLEKYTNFNMQLYKIINDIYRNCIDPYLPI